MKLKQLINLSSEVVDQSFLLSSNCRVKRGEVANRRKKRTGAVKHLYESKCQAIEKVSLSSCRVKRSQAADCSEVRMKHGQIVTSSQPVMPFCAAKPSKVKWQTAVSQGWKRSKCHQKQILQAFEWSGSTVNPQRTQIFRRAFSPQTFAKRYQSHIAIKKDAVECCKWWPPLTCMNITDRGAKTQDDAQTGSKKQGTGRNVVRARQAPTARKATWMSLDETSKFTMALSPKWPLNSCMSTHALSSKCCPVPVTASRKALMANLDMPWRASDKLLADGLKLARWSAWQHTMSRHMKSGYQTENMSKSTWSKLSNKRHEQGHLRPSNKKDEQQRSNWALHWKNAMCVFYSCSQAKKVTGPEKSAIIWMLHDCQ